MNLKRALARARSFSKRHNCKVEVEHVVGGYRKGVYECQEWYKGQEPGRFWWPSSVVEIIATYKNGKRLDVPNIKYKVQNGKLKIIK